MIESALEPILWKSFAALHLETNTLLVCCPFDIIINSQYVQYMGQTFQDGYYAKVCNVFFPSLTPILLNL